MTRSRLPRYCWAAPNSFCEGSWAITVRSDVLSGLVDELRTIREAVKRNVPDHHKPEAFHEVKSEIAHRLTLVMDSINSGIPIYDPNESKQ